MEGRVDDYLRLPIQLTEQVRRAVDEADSFKQECTDLNRKVEKLGSLLRKAARLSTNASSVFYEHPTKRIMEEAKKTLEKTLALVKKCKKSGILKRVITITSATDFRKVNHLVDSTTEDLNWLLTVSAGGTDSLYLGLPPIAANDPTLALIWQQIARVQAGTPDERADGASDLAALASDNERNGKIIIEEGGLAPLMKLLSEGTCAGQEAAVKALGELARDQQRAQEVVKAGAIPAFIHVLADAPVKVQTQAARSLASIVSHDSEAQSAFGAAGAIRHLVALINDTIEEAARKQVPPNMHTVVTTRMAQNKAGAPNKPWHDEEDKLENKPGLPQNDGSKATPNRQVKLNGSVDVHLSRKSHSRSSESLNLENGKTYYGSVREQNRRDREQEDPENIFKLRAEVVKALWKLAANNIKNCKSITDTRALLCFAKLIEKETGDVQRNSVLAVAEIAAVAEQDHELRKAAFKIHSQAVRAVVDQLLKVIQEGDPEVQIPSLKAIGCLCRIFPAKETHIVKPLTDQLGNRDSLVASEAATALQKFTASENYLKVEHSRSILEAGGAAHLVQLVYFGDVAQQNAVILLCNLTLNVGDHATLKSADALKALETASRTPQLMQVPAIREMLPKAIEHLELYQEGSAGHQEDEFDYYN